MKIEANFIDVMRLSEFAEKHDLTLCIEERKSPDHPDMRFYARFKCTEVKLDGMLCGAIGNGETPEKAVTAYIDQIKKRTLLVGAYTPDRKEIDVPRLTTEGDFPLDI